LLEALLGMRLIVSGAGSAERAWRGIADTWMWGVVIGWGTQYHFHFVPKNSERSVTEMPNSSERAAAGKTGALQLAPDAGVHRAATLLGGAVARAREKEKREQREGGGGERD
jgi:hypothetical protein